MKRRAHWWIIVHKETGQHSLVSIHTTRAKARATIKRVFRRSIFSSGSAVKVVAYTGRKPRLDSRGYPNWYWALVYKDDHSPFRLISFDDREQVETWMRKTCGDTAYQYKAIRVRLDTKGSGR